MMILLAFAMQLSAPSRVLGAWPGMNAICRPIHYK
jgi:hypothetical protein